MSAANCPNVLPYRTICALMTCAIVAFGVAIVAGVLEVRRPIKPEPHNSQSHPAPDVTPKTYVQRVKSAESLLDGQNVKWVYRFAGGLPKCWVEIDSEGHRQTLGPWVSVAHPGFVGQDPLDQPLPESVEGYVALFGPTAPGQTYRLVCAVTKVKYPDSPNQRLRTSGFRDLIEVKLPDLLPRKERPKGDGPDTSRGGSTINEGEEPQPIPAGQDTEINFLRNQEPPSGKDRSISLKIRFLTAEEITAARR